MSKNTEHPPFVNRYVFWYRGIGIFLILAAVLYCLNMTDIISFLKIIAGVSTLIVGAISGLWAYAKYILENGMFPPVNFYAVGKRIGCTRGKNIIELKLHLHNIGTTTLIARNIRLDLRYIKKDQKALEFLSGKGSGRLKFPDSIMTDAKIDPMLQVPLKGRKNEEKIKQENKKKPRGLLLMEYDTFIQAGVDQAYTFVTKISGNACCALIWASFEYAHSPSSWQKKILAFSRDLGLIQYTLEHAEHHHSVEEVFWIDDAKRPRRHSNAHGVNL